MPVLLLEAEQRSNGHRWFGEFSAQYIEEMSLKTGNFKKFNLFVRMLKLALDPPAAAAAADTPAQKVFIDLLTPQDLEALKARKQPQGAIQLQPQLLLQRRAPSWLLQRINVTSF